MEIDAHRDVLAWVDDPLPALALLDNPRNALIARDSNGFHLLDPATQQVRPLRGLTKPLAECFWPQYDRPPRGGSSSSRMPARGKARGRSSSGSGSSSMHAARGTLRGNIVHRQLDDLVTLDAASFHRRNPLGAHPYAERILRAILNVGMRPLAIEFSAGDAGLKLATGIDVITVDKSGHVNFIEVKTGYEGAATWSGSTSWMRGPLHGVLRNSAENRAIVQIMLGALLAVKSAGFTAPFTCWVLHVTDSETEFVEVDAGFVDKHGPVLWHALAAHMAKTAAAGGAKRSRGGGGGGRK